MSPALVVHRGAGVNLGIEVVAAEKSLYTVLAYAAIDVAVLEVFENILEVFSHKIEKLGTGNLLRNIAVSHIIPSAGCVSEEVDDVEVRKVTECAGLAYELLCIGVSSEET